MLATDGAFRVLRALRNLPSGWHFGEGVVIDSKIIDAGLVLHGALLHAGYKTTDAFPGVGGEVQVTGYGADFIELTIRADGMVDLYRERDDMEIQSVASLTLEQAIQSIVPPSGCVSLPATNHHVTIHAKKAESHNAT